MTDKQIIDLWSWIAIVFGAAGVYYGVGFLLFGFGLAKGLVGMASAFVSYLCWLQVEKTRGR